MDLLCKVFHKTTAEFGVGQKIRRFCMKFKNVTFRALILFASLASSGEFSGVAISFPEEATFEQITNNANDEQYLKEWVPVGKTELNTDWIITQQKIKLARKKDAKKYLEEMFKLARQSCTDVKYNGPEKRNLGNIDSYWGRLMCAQVLEKSYGVFTEFRVIAIGLEVYVITSEIRLPPTKKAGMFEFKTSDDMDTTMKKLGKSATLARDQVYVCQQTGCP